MASRDHTKRFMRIRSMYHKSRQFKDRQARMQADGGAWDETPLTSSLPPVYMDTVTDINRDTDMIKEKRKSLFDVI